MPIAEVGQFPVQPAGKAAFGDHQIAGAEVTMDHHGWRGRRQVVAQPGEAQCDHWTIAACLFELAGEALDALRRVKFREERQTFGREGMNPGHGSGEVRRETGRR